MAWEIEYEHVDKAEGVHRYGLIERSVTTRDGEPARAKYHILLGTGADGKTCPHCQGEVKSGCVLETDGALRPSEQFEYALQNSIWVATLAEHRPHDLVKEHVAKLNDFHARMDAYTARHKATPYKGPK